LDLAGALQQIISHPHFAKENGTFNYSNLGSATWYDFAFAIFQHLDKAENITPITTDGYPTPAKRPKFTVMDKSKITATFDLQIPHWQTTLNEELRRY
jgi:dTDP-4-dehydrorhamnose reductase